MQSKITIEIDFENGNEPILQIICRDSDDIRDKLIKAFLQKLRGSSTWCKIYCTHTTDGPGTSFWKISPIGPNDFLPESKIMIEQATIDKVPLPTNM